MSSIQGVSTATATSIAPKPQAPVKAAKSEVQETAQDERTEALRGTQEVSEASPNGKSGVGSKVNLTA